MKILITGVGITGKSTFRKALKKSFPKAVDIDGDYDYKRFPEKFDEQTMYIIEDVHGLMTEERCLPLEDYDRIIYLLPDLISHVLFWLKRVWRWFQNGSGSWDKKREDWLGSKKEYDLRNIPLFLSLMICDLRNRSKWMTEDVEVLYPFRDRVVVIHSSFSKEGIKFSFTHRF